MSDFYKQEEDVILTPEVEDIASECPDCDVPVIEPIEGTEGTQTNPIDIENTLAKPVSEFPETSEPLVPTITIGQFFGTLQESVINIWKLHLNTKKHFIHQELDYLYHVMLAKTDSMIEQYMGIVGGTIPSNEYVNTIYLLPETTEVLFLMQLRDYIIKGRNILFPPEWSELWSTVDEVLSALDSTIYKLSNFDEQPVLTFEQFCFEKYKPLNESCEDCGDSDEEEE